MNQNRNSNSQNLADKGQIQTKDVNPTFTADYDHQDLKNDFGSLKNITLESLEVVMENNSQQTVISIKFDTQVRSNQKISRTVEDLISFQENLSQQNLLEEVPEINYMEILQMKAQEQLQMFRNHFKQLLDFIQKNNLGDQDLKAFLFDQNCIDILPDYQKKPQQISKEINQQKYYQQASSNEKNKRNNSHTIDSSNLSEQRDIVALDLPISAQKIPKTKIMSNIITKPLLKKDKMNKTSINLKKKIIKNYTDYEILASEKAHSLSLDSILENKDEQSWNLYKAYIDHEYIKNGTTVFCVEVFDFKKKKISYSEKTYSNFQSFHKKAKEVAKKQKFAIGELPDRGKISILLNQMSPKIVAYRKFALKAYLNFLLSDPDFCKQEILINFLEIPLQYSLNLFKQNAQ